MSSNQDHDDARVMPTFARSVIRQGCVLWDVCWHLRCITCSTSLSTARRLSFQVSKCHNSIRHSKVSMAGQEHYTLKSTVICNRKDKEAVRLYCVRNPNRRVVNTGTFLNFDPRLRETDSFRCAVLDRGRLQTHIPEKKVLDPVYNEPVAWRMMIDRKLV
jgi:hypothetical protein